VFVNSGSLAFVKFAVKLAKIAIVNLLALVS
jgi:hypothetical protein